MWSPQELALKNTYFLGMLTYPMRCGKICQRGLGGVGRSHDAVAGALEQSSRDTHLANSYFLSICPVAMDTVLLWHI